MTPFPTHDPISTFYNLRKLVRDIHISRIKRVRAVSNILTADFAVVPLAEIDSGTIPSDEDAVPPCAECGRF